MYTVYQRVFKLSDGSNRYYVGFTTNLYSRTTVFEAQLWFNRCTKRQREAFESSKMKFSTEILGTFETKQAARDFETAQILKHKQLNVSLNERLSAKLVA